MARGEIRAKLGFDVEEEELVRGTRKAEERMARHGRAVENTFKDSSSKSSRHIKQIGDSYEREGSRIGRIMGQVKGYIAGAFSVALIGSTARSLIGVNAEMETYHATLKAVLGTAEAATAKLAFVRKFAATTPFQLPQLVEATVRLEAYGITAETVMQTVGDTAAAMGKDIMSVVEAVADAQTGEFERLKEFGIKAIQEGGKTFLMYTDQQGKEQKAIIDRNNRAIITGTLQAIWNDKYEGAMRERAATFSGTMSNLGDLAYEMTGQIGRGIFDAVKNDAKELLDTINEMQATGEWASMGSRIGSSLASGYKTLKDMLQTLREYGPALMKIVAILVVLKATQIAVNSGVAAYHAILITGKAIQQTYVAATLLFNAAMMALRGQTIGATIAMVGFNTVIRANPLGILLTIVSAVAAGLLLFRDRTDDAADAQGTFAQKTRESIAAIKEMDGAMLLSTQKQLQAQRQSQRSMLDSLHNLKRLMKAQTFQDTRQIDPDTGTHVVRRGEDIKREYLANLDQEIIKAGTAIKGTAQQQSEIDRQINTDLNKRIEYLQAQQTVLQATGQVTPELEEVNRQLADLIKQRDKLQSAGLVPTDGGAADDGALKKARELLAAFNDIQILMHADPAVRSHYEEILQLSGEIAELEEQIAKVRGTEEAEALKRIADGKREQQQALRDYMLGLREFQQLVKTMPNGGRMATRPLDAGNFVKLMTDADLLKKVNGIVERVNKEVQAVKLDLRFGNLTAEQAGEKIAGIAAGAQAELKELYETFKDLLPQEAKDRIEQFLNSIVEDTEKAGQNARELAKQLQGIASAARGMLRLSDAVGVVSEEVAALLGGVVDAIDGFSELQEVRAAKEAGEISSGSASLATIAGIAGIAGSVAGAAIGFINAQSAAKEEMRRLRDALYDNASEIREAMEDAFKGGNVASNVSGQQMEQARSIIGQIQGLPKNARNERLALLKQLQGLGIPGMEGVMDLNESLFNVIDGSQTAYRQGWMENGKGGVRRAVDSILFGDGQYSGVDLLKWLEEYLPEGFENFSDFLDRAASNLGAYTNDVAGAVQKFEDVQKYLGFDLPAALDQFIDHLLSTEKGLDKSVTDFLKEAKGLDLNTDEGKARLREIVESMASMSPGQFGSLSLEDMQQVWDTLLGAADGQGLATEKVSRSSEVARSITEFQTNELLAYQVEQVFLHRREVEILGAMLNALTGQAMGSILPPNLASAIDSTLTRTPIQAAEAQGMVSSGSPYVKGPLTIPITVQGHTLPEVMTKIELALRKENLF